MCKRAFASSAMIFVEEMLPGRLPWQRKDRLRTPSTCNPQSHLCPVPAPNSASYLSVSLIHLFFHCTACSSAHKVFHECWGTLPTQARFAKQHLGRGTCQPNSLKCLLCILWLWLEPALVVSDVYQWGALPKHPHLTPFSWPHLTPFSWPFHLQGPNISFVLLQF
jgi:hypothetical protein